MRMKLFLDTADLGAIKEFAATGLIDGITTNPSLVAKEKRDFKALIADICESIQGPVSAEVAALGAEEMVREGRTLARIAKNVAVKVPLTWDGLKACRKLTSEGTMVNVTLCFAASQALLAAKAGATFVSPFIGRLDDIGLDGIELVRDIRGIYDAYPALSTEILAASIRNVGHVTRAAALGADIATMPPAVFQSLIAHPLTEKGIAQFLADWKKTGQSILER